MTKVESSSGGWTGKIARVDLASRQVTISSSLDMARDYVGGRGFAARLYWDDVRPGIDGLSPENQLMLMAGPLGGSQAIACSRLVVSGKSPLLFPDQYGHATIGGSVCPALKLAGFDGIVISGRANGPVCLYIADGAVRFDDAGALWGLDTQETLEKLQAVYGEAAEALCIGPAGERLVRFALAVTKGGSCAGHGFGAVMGSKHIKAIVFQGTGIVPVARPEQLKEVNRRIRGLIKGRQLMDPLIQGIELVRRAPCRGCPAGCSRGIYKHVSGATEHRKNCASAYFYYDWDKKYHGGQASDQTFLATSLCDRAGMCTQELTKMMDWLYACIQQGLIRQEETGLPFDEIGSRTFLDAFMQQLVQRTGFGDLLAEGVMRAARSIGRGTEQLLEKTLSDTGFSAGLYNGRYFITTAIFHATDPTNPMAQLHEVCYPLFKWILWHVTDGNMSSVDTEAFRAIARRFWGGETAVDFSTYAGKAEAAFMIQNRTYAKETLVACDFFYPVVTPEGAPDHVGDPVLESQLLSAVTGLDFDEQSYYRVGERVFNLTRAIHCREGRRGRQHDCLPEFNFTEPLTSDKSNYFFMFNPECMLPGKQGELVSRKGAVLEKDKFEAMLSDFYRLRGWDERSGFQTEQCLQGLNLDFLFVELRKKGLLI